MVSRRLWLALLVVLSLPTSVRADVYTELTGTRSLAMGGAHRALGANNETLWLNPAGMAIARRYSIDVQYGYGSGDRLNHLNASVVDSKSGPVAGGMAVTRSWGNESGTNPSLNRFYLGSAYALGPGVALGLTASYVRGNYAWEGVRRDVNSFNSTVGLLINVGEVLGLGVSYQNLLPNEPSLFRPVLGSAVSLHTSVASLSADLLLDTRASIAERLDWHVGAEVFLFELMALRAGYHRSAPDVQPNSPKMHFASGGLGIVNTTGAFNASCERNIGPGNPSWRFVGSVQFFM